MFRSGFIFIVCGPIATKFCTGIDNQSVSSNMKKLHNINDVIDSDVIILRHLAKKTVKKVYFKIAAASSSFYSLLLKLYGNINHLCCF